MTFHSPSEVLLLLLGKSFPFSSNLQGLLSDCVSVIAFENSPLGTFAHIGSSPITSASSVLITRDTLLRDGRFSFSFLAASLPINLFLSSLTKRSNEHSYGP